MNFSAKMTDGEKSEEISNKYGSLRSGCIMLRIS